MGGMVSNKERAIKEFAEFFGWAWRVDMEQVIQAFCGCDMVSFGADAAYSLGYLWHVLSQSPFREFLKSPQFWHLEIAVLHLSGVIEEYLYFAVTLQPGNGVYGYFLHFILALLNSESGRL
jgi:hypothetical protein